MTQTQSSKPFDLAALNDNSGSMNQHMGVEILEASIERCVARMPVEPNRQPYGLLHGGASIALAETLGSIGSALHAATMGKIAVGLDINATHHRSARSGWVTGVATPLHLGRTVASFEIVISDEDERRLCTCRITCALLEAPPGS